MNLEDDDELLRFVYEKISCNFDKICDNDVIKQILEKNSISKKLYVQQPHLPIKDIQCKTLTIFYMLILSTFGIHRLKVMST